ncbi:splicing factor 3A subunit 1 [Planococcus citri]|uniref:splicing factor 3A subunit 1 n=1 Tax=Planococcus citri TaxID=170843 RepID=UPI0031F89E66
MPSVDVPVPVAPAPENPEPPKESAPATLPVIGIIYPPPEYRNIVDKTANFVSRNGPEFESKIKKNEQGNPKFSFLNTGDPYHAYYLHKVKEFKEGRGQDGQSGTDGQKSVTSATHAKQQELLSKVQIIEQPFVPKDPPPEFEFICDPPSISALDLDIVKLTAQFVARNGRNFLTTLMNKEQRNYQFDFLRPQHSLFQYFTKLLEQYTKVLIPPKDLTNKLREESTHPQVVLDQVKYRADWQRHQEAQKRKEEMIIEKERIAYAQIDWHDFVVVETVDYQMSEIGNFPPPTTPEEVGARVLMQDRQTSKRNGDDDDGNDDNEMQIGSDDEMMDRSGRQRIDMESSGDESEDEAESLQRRLEETKSREGKDNTQVEDMEEESSSDSEGEENEIRMPPLPIDKKQFGVPAPHLPPLPPAPDKVIVKKGYDPKQATKQIQKQTADELISPLTGTKIPASKVQEHMRIGLLDPRWVEQRDKHIQEKINQESVFAPGTAIEASLKQLAERRTDIFGVGDEETAIGKKIGEEDVRKDDKITWDGHTSSVEAATRAARANITIEDQIHQIHKVKGLLPDEEKEKIGPKPVVSEAFISKGPVVIAAPHVSKTPLIGTLPNAVAPPPMPKPQNITAAPPMPPQNRPLPPPPPPGILPTPAAPVMLIPGGVPQMQARPPLMGEYVPQHQQGFQMMAPGGNPVPQAYITPQPPMGAPPIQPGMKHPLDKPEEEPLVKKPRTEESLEPERVFLEKFLAQGPVKFKVVLPSMPDKAEWKLNGQIIELSMPLTDSIAVIKTEIHKLTSMPTGKQKLNWEGLFLKDANSLAYYNITPATVLQLQLKERGGRKK